MKSKFYLLFLVMLVLQVIPLGEWLETYFSFPAAYLTSLFLNLPLSSLEGGFLLKHHQLSISVTRECSAWDFFCILNVLILYHLSEFFRWDKKVWQLWVLSIPLIYCLTLFINVIRIVCCFYGGLFYRPIIPDFFWPSAHLAAGVFVFVPSLILINLFFIRRNNCA